MEGLPNNQLHPIEQPINVPLTRKERMQQNVAGLPVNFRLFDPAQRLNSRTRNLLIISWKQDILSLFNDKDRGVILRKAKEVIKFSFDKMGYNGIYVEYSPERRKPCSTLVGPLSRVVNDTCAYTVPWLTWSEVVKSMPDGFVNSIVHDAEELRINLLPNKKRKEQPQPAPIEPNPRGPEVRELLNLVPRFEARWNATQRLLDENSALQQKIETVRNKLAKIRKLNQGLREENKRLQEEDLVRSKLCRLASRQEEEKDRFDEGPSQLALQQACINARIPLLFLRLKALEKKKQGQQIEIELAKSELSLIQVEVLKLKMSEENLE